MKGTLKLFNKKDELIMEFSYQHSGQRKMLMDQWKYKYGKLLFDGCYFQVCPTVKVTDKTLERMEMKPRKKRSPNPHRAQKKEYDTKIVFSLREKGYGIGQIAKRIGKSKYYVWSIVNKQEYA
jgi:hypothetical protein